MSQRGIQISGFKNTWYVQAFKDKRGDLTVCFEVEIYLSLTLFGKNKFFTWFNYDRLHNTKCPYSHNNSLLWGCWAGVENEIGYPLFSGYWLLSKFLHKKVTHCFRKAHLCSTVSERSKRRVLCTWKKLRHTPTHGKTHRSSWDVTATTIPSLCLSLCQLHLQIPSSCRKEKLAGHGKTNQNWKWLIGIQHA